MAGVPEELRSPHRVSAAITPVPTSFHSIMEKRIIPEVKAGLLALLLCHAGVLAVATPPTPPPAEEAVILTGWLQVASLSMKDAIVEVVVNGTRQIAPVSEAGRFTVSLPADAEVVLRFEKPGHLTKEVMVDTRHAREGKEGHKRRHVKFGVVLELERWMGGLTYAGPVGAIGFEQGGGCLAVAHDRSMVPAEHRAPMGF